METLSSRYPNSSTFTLLSFHHIMLPFSYWFFVLIRSRRISRLSTPASNLIMSLTQLIILILGGLGLVTCSSRGYESESDSTSCWECLRYFFNPRIFSENVPKRRTSGETTPIIQFPTVTLPRPKTYEQLNTNTNMMPDQILLDWVEISDEYGFVQNDEEDLLYFEATDSLRLDDYDLVQLPEDVESTTSDSS